MGQGGIRKLQRILLILASTLVLPARGVTTWAELAARPAPPTIREHAQTQPDPCPLPTDLDWDGVVASQDLALAAARWQQPLTDPRFDLDDDGDVDVVDVMHVAAAWNTTGPTLPRLPGEGRVWAEGSTRKIRPTDPPPPSTWVWDGCRVRLHAARNETEPLQLVITAGTQALTGVRVTASDLNDGAGNTIPQDRITLYREAYHNVPQPSDPWGEGLPAGELGAGLIPDALIPFRDPYGSGREIGVPFDVPAGQNQPVWIDVTVPPGTPPGKYTGTLTVTTDQGSLTVPLTLVVWNFTLPTQPSLFIGFLMDPFWTLPPQYGVTEGTSAFYDLVDKHYEALAAHRLGPLWLYREPAVNEVDGQVVLDWSQADPQYEHWLDTRQLPAFFVPDVYDGLNERYRIRDDSGAYYTQAAFNDPTFVRKAKAYYAALRDHLIARGWWDNALAFPTDETEWVADEPGHNGPAGYQRLRAWAELLKAVSPDYRIAASGIYPIPVGPADRGWPDLRGLIDDWSVVVQDADADPALWEQRQALGETLSFYFNDWGDFLDYKATLHRGLGWVAYKYRAWAITGWAVAAWIGNRNTMDIVNPWTNWPVDPAFGTGGGALFWPGKAIEGDPNKNVDGPLPSIRLKLAREAVEDHDYLALLAAQTSPAYARALARGLIPRDYWDWDPAPESIYRLRDRIGRLLDHGASVPLATVQGHVTDAATGAPIKRAFVTDGLSGALTDATGAYTVTVRAPAAGIVSLRYAAPRYEETSRTVTIPADGQAMQDVALTRVPEESLLLFSFETRTEWEGNWEFSNAQPPEPVPEHATDGSLALKVVFKDDLAGGEAGAGTGEFPTSDWSVYDALEFDVYNESDYYTDLEVGVGDGGTGWYPQTGGTITLLPQRAHHVIVPTVDIAASGVDLTDVTWLELAPETIATDDEGVPRWPAGPRTLYLDNFRLVHVR